MAAANAALSLVGLLLVVFVGLVIFAAGLSLVVSIVFIVLAAFPIVIVVWGAFEFFRHIRRRKMVFNGRARVVKNGVVIE